LVLFFKTEHAFFNMRQQVASIGSAGDGVLQTADGPVHVPRTLPGEAVARGPIPARGRNRRAALIEILAPSPDRIEPPCRHFGACGGCALQHWQDSSYAAWKRGLVVQALEQAGFASDAVAPLARTPPHARRRMDFAVRRIDGGVLLGLHAPHAQDIVDIDECVVLHPALLRLLPPLRALMSSLAALRRSGSVIANLLDSGPDLLLRTDGPLVAQDRAKIAAFAASHGVSRVSWALGDGATETAAQLAAPFVSFAGHRVEPPAGAFLQASAEGERAIVAAVLAGLPGRLTPRSRAIELYAGCGTISFALAERLRVIAYEGDAASVAAVRRAMSGSRVDIALRDLVRQPLAVKEFAGASAIVLDPPYAGASMQMPAIAASGVERVIMVSCNPQALAKDAAVLKSRGYALVGATPIDQFLWSPHVESVSVFRKHVLF
jgi:23S rRNA (uracil1939-C5)-methyltransferase